MSDLIAIKPSSEKLDRFLDYLVEVYVEEDALFPPEVWAAKSPSSSRTTNACESFHSHLNKCFNFAHPNVFVFLEAIIDYQSEIYIQVQSVTKRKKTNTHTEKRVKFLTEQIEKLNKNEISVLEYVKLTSHYYSAHF